jgi:ABC-type nitrate/sulfonate/bicarbonate transport system permease component
MRHRLVSLAARLGVVAAVVACWELGASAASNQYFLTPSAIVAGMYHKWFSGPAGHFWLTPDATGNLLPSLGRMLGGLAVASVAGVVLGVAIGRMPVLADLTEPLIHFGRAIPAVTMVPVFLFVFRIGTSMEVAAIAFGVIWPVLLNTIDGARHLYPGYMESARAFRLGPGQRLLRVILPSAAPKIFAGLRLALALALVLMIVSEFQGSTDGIGREMSIAQANFDVPTMWDIIVLLGLLGIVLNGVFALVERRALAWQHGAASTSK